MIKKDKIRKPAFNRTFPEDNFISAARYLIAARDYVRGHKIPENFTGLPEIQDACHSHNSTFYFIGISYPNHVERDQPYILTDNEGAQRQQGFSDHGLMSSLEQVLKSQKVDVIDGTMQQDFDSRNKTHLIQLRVRPEHYARGRVIITRCLSLSAVDFLKSLKSETQATFWQGARNATVRFITRLSCARPTQQEKNNYDNLSS